MDYNDKLTELLIELLGTETVLNELLRALTSDEVKYNMDYIARNYDISTEDL